MRDFGLSGTIWPMVRVQEGRGNNGGKLGRLDGRLFAMSAGRKTVASVYFFPSEAL